jgi:hypothetical protein
VAFRISVRHARGHDGAVFREGAERVGHHLRQRGGGVGLALAQLVGHGDHEGRLALVFTVVSGQRLAQLHARALRRPHGEVFPQALAAQVQQHLGDGQRAVAHQQLEQLFHRLGLALGRAGQAQHERRREPAVLHHQVTGQQPVTGGQRGLRLHGDAGRQRRRRAAPLGDAQARREVVVDLLLERGDRVRQQPACRGHVPPHQRLAVVQQAVPGLAHLGRAEDLHARCVAVRRALRRLARRALDQAGREPARGQGPHGRAQQPLVAQLVAGDEGIRQAVCAGARADGQVQREGDAGAHPRPAEHARAPERQARGQRHEGGRVARVQAPEHQAPDLALGVARGQGGREFVERGRREGAREPLEVVQQPVRAGALHAAQQVVRVQPLERRRVLQVDDGGAQRGEALTPQATTLLGVLQPMELRQAFEVVARPHEGGSA